MSGEHDHDQGEHYVRDLKIIAIFVLLIGNLIAFTFPSLLVKYYISEDDDQQERRKKERRVNLTIKFLTAFAIGVILAGAVLHLLPHGASELAESGNALFKENHGDEHHKEEEHNCSKNESAHHEDEEDHHDDKHGDSHENHDHAYPFAFLFFTVALVVSYISTTEANWYGAKKMLAHSEQRKAAALAANPAGEESCNHQKELKEEARTAVIVSLWTTLVGVICHCMISGISLGVSTSEDTVRTLVIVSVFHEFFEALSIGTLLVQAEFTFWESVLIFVLTALGEVLGIGIGMGITGKVDKVGKGVMLCIAAGILVYSTMSEMLPQLLNVHYLQHSNERKFGCCAINKIPLAKIVEANNNNNSSNNNQNNNNNNENQIEIPEKKKSDDEQQQQQQQDRSLTAVAVNDNNNNNNNKEDDDMIIPHDDDADFSHRFLVYTCFVLGLTLQAVIGIWE